MFIDDLLFAYTRLKSKRQSIEKLEHRKKAAIDSMNQPVRIRDLVVRAEITHRFSESRPHTNPYTNINESTRLLDHINSLFTLANEDHRANNSQKMSDISYELKADRKNNIYKSTKNSIKLCDEN